MKNVFLIAITALVASTAFAGSGTKAVKPKIPFAGTVQAMIDAVPDGNTNWVTLTIPVGRYEESVFVPKSKNFIRLVAEKEGKVFLATPYSVFNAATNGWPRCTALEVNCGDFEAVGIVFENTASRASFNAGGRGVGQALAVKTGADRGVYRRCSFLGHQDTIQTTNRRSRQYFEDCYFEGTVDYIFGDGTALFNRCRIYSLAGGYVTAACTIKEIPFGYVFKDCVLTTAPECKGIDLGRPWRGYAAVAFVNCYLPHGVTRGWNNWARAENEATARYGEYGCFGPGAYENNVAARVKWVDHDPESWKRKLAANGCVTEFDILKGTDGWCPRITN